MSQYTLEHLYSLSNSQLRRIHGGSLSQVVTDLNLRGLLSDHDKQIHNSKSFKLILESPKPILLEKYNISHYFGTNHTDSLKIYRNGVNFKDLIYAIYNHNDLVTGVLEYIPKPGEKIEGVYEKSGKVEKSRGEPFELDPTNPYSYLSVGDLRKISNSRNVHIPSPSHSLVLSTILNNYDQVDNRWKQGIISGDFYQLNREEIKFKGAIEGINMRGNNALSTQELINLIKINRIVGPHHNPVLPRTNLLSRNTNRLSRSVWFNLSNNQGYVISGNNVDTNYNQLAKYPTYLSFRDYNLVYNTNYIILTILMKNKYGEDAYFLDSEGLKFLATRGYIDPITNIPKIKERYNIIKDYPNSLIYKLSQIYDIEFANDYKLNKYIIARTNLHPLESVAINFKPILDTQDPENVTSQYSKSIGMIIPPNIQDKPSYFWNNLDKYNKVLTRPITTQPINTELLSPGLISPFDIRILLSNYTDNEIFQYTGAYIPYQSREEIINNVISIRNQDRFFIPTVRKCSNEETVTTLEETNDMDVFIIAFGNMFEYFCYDLDDILQNFREYDIEGLVEPEGQDKSFEFRKPEDPNQLFDLSDIRSLIRVIELYENIPDATQALERIRDGITRTVSSTEYDRRIMAEFNQLNNTDQKLIKDWLEQLFLTGMYMRRWQGPGSPYPLTESSSQGPDPNDKVNQEMTVLGYYPLAKISPTQYQPSGVGGITEKMSTNARRFVNNLRAVEYVITDGVRVPNQKTATIGSYLDKIRKGTYCIRMGSSYFIGTGFYYLRGLFKHIIPNFDPSTLERIV